MAEKHPVNQVRDLIRDMTVADLQEVLAFVTGRIAELKKDEVGTSLFLVQCPSDRSTQVAAMKLVRGATGLSLKEANDLVVNASAKYPTFIGDNNIAVLKQQLEALGCTLEIR